MLNDDFQFAHSTIVGLKFSSVNCFMTIDTSFLQCVRCWSISM